MSTAEYGKLGRSAVVDPLLESLLFVSQLYNGSNNKAALISGLPLRDGMLTPELLPRAASQAGLAAQLVCKPISGISSLLLPCILLLGEQQACVLIEIDALSQQVKLLLPHGGGGERWCAMSLLEKDYSGSCFFVRQQLSFDERAPETLALTPKHWLWNIVLKSKKIYRDVFIGSVWINIFAIAVPLFTLYVYDHIVPSLAFDSLWSLAIGAWIVLVFDYAMRIGRSFYLHLAARKVDVQISAKIYAKVMAMKLAYRPASVGAFSKQLQDFDVIRDVLASACVTSLLDIPFILLFLSMIVWFGHSLVLLPLLAILILLGYSLWIQKKTRHSVELARRLATQLHADVVETVTALETVKLCAAETRHQYAWEQAVAAIASCDRVTRKLSNSVTVLGGFIQQSTVVAIVVMGAYMIAADELTLGEMIAVVMLSDRAMLPMLQLAALSTRYNQAKRAVFLMNSIMDFPEEQQAGNKYVAIDQLRGELEFAQVYFCYPNTQLPALKHINCHIQQGEKVGIIGLTGSGKTTLQRLLAGLYQPTAGCIRVDGIDIRQLHPADLRCNIGCVPQEITLFTGSIKENISLGRPHADAEQIMQAADIAGVCQFTGDTIDGLARQVGEGGRCLSGGQRQAIAIARAMLTEPPVLVFDEPTRHMDNRAEARFQQQLHQLGQHTTLLLVTHKAAMLDVVDRLIVLDAGCIAADGEKSDILTLLRAGKLSTSPVIE